MPSSRFGPRSAEAGAATGRRRASKMRRAVFSRFQHRRMPIRRRGAPRSGGQRLT